MRRAASAAATVADADAASALARVRIDAPDLCGRYTMRVISGVAVGPAPAWMAARLRAVGLRPISNVVDVTNYVLWERGHPLHAFDADIVADDSIVVRRARAGERFTTLDGQERALTDAMLVIADPTKTIGLAGVMGGAATEVAPGTRQVLLEAAHFAPASIRRTSRALGLVTDAAHRFERGADIEGLVDASARAAQLIAELAGGAIARGFIDVYPSPRPRPRVTLRMSRAQRVLGVAPSRPEAARILTSLGLLVADSGSALEVEVPSFRRDLTMEDDLVEEIIRVWGYDRIPSTPPTGAISVVTQPDAFRQEQTVREALVAAGLTEVMTYTFGDPERAALLPGLEGEEVLELLNPLSQEASIMRRHPLEGILSAVAFNLRHRQSDLSLFEVGRTYGRRPEGLREPRWAVVAVTGARHRGGWWESPGNADLYDAKGYAEHVLGALGIHSREVRPLVAPGLEPDAAAALVVDGQMTAIFGEVAAVTRERLEIAVPVFAAMIPLDVAARLPRATPRYEPLPRHPSVTRDVAFVLEADQSITAQAMETAMAAEAGPLLREMSLFDVFRFPDGRRSLAWRLVFQAADRTLTDDEVNAVHARMVERVCDHLHISLRGT